MLQPVTEIAKRFNADCLALSDTLRDSEAVVSGGDKHERVSKAIQVFFESIQRLPNEIAPQNTQGTILFEIDCALLGLYGSSMFVGSENGSSVRVLLRDLVALWQRYYLISALERSAAGSAVPGTMKFYDGWSHSGNTNDQGPEYDRLLADVSFVLDSSESLNVSAKVMLFSLMGKLLLTLGVSDEFAQEKLLEHAGDFESREGTACTLALPEILLCMQVLASKGRTLESTGLDPQTVRKAIRFWSSKDDFLDKLCKSWGWNQEFDFVSPLAMGDTVKLREQSILFQTWATGSAKLNIGHSYIEWEEHRSKNPTLMNVFQPIPIFVFGNSGVGKSSLLSAFCYHVQMRAGKAMTLGRELQVYYEATAKAWRNGGMSATTGWQAYNFWEDLGITSYALFDYAGKDTQPEQWEHKLQETIRNAKGLLFLVDAEECSEPEKLRSKAGRFAAILEYWMMSNPSIRHVPVALVVTKCDTLFGEAIAKLSRTSLVPENIQHGLVEMLIPRRFPTGTDELHTSSDRLRSVITSDRINNTHPVLQDVTQNILDNFAQFFARVIGLTYNYQIFLTSARPPREPNDGVFPWGVKDPFEWTIRVLEKFYLRESFSKFREDEKQVEDDIKVIREDYQHLQRLIDTMNHHNNEIARLRQKPSLFQATMRDRIKFHDDEKQKTEQEFITKVQHYQSDYNDPNRHRGAQILDHEIRRREQVLGEIRQKRTEFENRLRGR
jgi:GTPase SAR1 family protein